MRDNTMFCGFNPAVSPAALKTMQSTATTSCQNLLRMNNLCGNHN
jgi:hypothetical protein